MIENLMDKLPKNELGGVKDDSSKLRYDLIDFKSIEQMVSVLTMGANKYGPDNWKNVEDERYVAATMRHFFSHQLGELTDRESGQPHLAHVLCNVMFLLAKANKQV